MASCDEPYADDGTTRGAAPCDSVAQKTQEITVDTTWQEPKNIDLDEDSGL